LTVENNAAWRERDEARAANPVTITKAQFALLQKVFHPDPEHDTATPERKQQLLKAAQAFNAIKFKVLGRKEKPKPRALNISRKRAGGSFTVASWGYTGVTKSRVCARPAVS
jgi:hypothetical protein